jgi:hypothetical protein
LIELNQANRGDLVRSPTRGKLLKFIGKLNETTTGATSLWYFFTIHDAVLFPLVNYLQFKDHVQYKRVAETKKSDTTNKNANANTSDDKDDKEDQGTTTLKRSREGSPLEVETMVTATNTTKRWRS